MLNADPLRRIALSLAVLAGVPCASATTAQERTDPTAAINAWVDSDHGDRALLERATAAVLDAGATGMRALATTVKTTRSDQRDRRIGVETLLADVVVGALRRGVDSGMRFAGQYDDLRELQPFAGRYLLSLVLDTPDWFPDDMRPLVVPALRDVFVKAPDADALKRLREVAVDEDFEAQPLREALQYALAQWGQRDLVQKRIDDLTTNAGSGKDTDELHFVHALAKLHYELRDFVTASTHWLAFVDGMTKLELEVTALDRYDAACSLSRAGRLEDALAQLRASAALIAAGRQDSTAEITREMFETDPDLRAARSRAEFAGIVATAFPKHDDASDGKRR